ncbi:DUF2637 domain-containing protein [Actinomadura keratinilytica]|uniref:DUF2637 domain-containing protein n=1 Tax=Actinomadura keratinilytica TaxID=547461 RepID=UPI003614B5AE
MAVGSPALIAWRGQLEFALEKMKLGLMSPLLPVAIEGSVLYSAFLTHRAVAEGLPAGRYRALTWTLAGVAAGMNFWHGSTGKDGSAEIGVALGLTSLLSIVLLELTTALRKHKERKARSGRGAAEIRRALIRRVRYPRLSMQAAALAAARDITAEEAWRAAWVDRYGVGPESTRRERRTARVILAREQRAARKAAKAGGLTIAEGSVRPASEPTAPDRRTAPDQEAVLALFGLDLSDEALAQWLDEPPAGGSSSHRPAPGGGGPEGGSRAAGELAQISDDQRERGLAEEDRLKAAGARRSRGQRSRARVAEYMAEHPDATIGQIAKALRMSPATVKRHRQALRGER